MQKKKEDINEIFVCPQLFGLSQTLTGLQNVSEILNKLLDNI